MYKNKVLNLCFKKLHIYKGKSHFLESKMLHLAHKMFQQRQLKSFNFVAENSEKYD